MVFTDDLDLPLIIVLRFTDGLNPQVVMENNPQVKNISCYLQSLSPMAQEYPVVEILIIQMQFFSSAHATISHNRAHPETPFSKLKQRNFNNKRQFESVFRCHLHYMMFSII